MKSKDLRLLLTLSGGRRFIFISLVHAFLLTCVVIANAALISRLIIGVINRDANLYLLSFSLLTLWLLRAAITSQFERWALNQSCAMKAQLRREITSNASLVMTTSPTELSNLLIKGANSLDTYIGRLIPQIFSASVLPICVIMVVGYYDLLSAIIAIITLPLIPIFGALIGKYTEDAVSAKWQSLGTLGKYFEDSLKGIHTLTIFGRARKQDQRIEEMGEHYTRETMKVLRISFLSALVLELCGTISVALIAVSIGLRLVNGTMEFLPALTILILAPEVYFPLRNAASLFHASADGVEALNNLTAKRAMTDQVEWGDYALDSFATLSVPAFRHPFSSDAPLFPAFNVSKKDFVWIQGSSGVGKSTLVRNILGLRRDVEIAINDVAQCDYRKESLFSRLSWVPQNPRMIGHTVRDEFTLLEPACSDERIIELLKKVHLEVSDLPEGLQSRTGGVGERVAQLSGGQLRRLAIARALLKNPELLIADEPSADLDSMNARFMYQLLQEVHESGVAIILIAHGDIDGCTPTFAVEPQVSL